MMIILPWQSMSGINHLMAFAFAYRPYSGQLANRLAKVPSHTHGDIIYPSLERLIRKCR